MFVKKNQQASEFSKRCIKLGSWYMEEYNGGHITDLVRLLSKLTNTGPSKECTHLTQPP
jgi:hypothetical protein